MIKLFIFTTILLSNIQESRKLNSLEKEWEISDFVFIANVNKIIKPPIYNAFGREVLVFQLVIEEVFKGLYLDNETKYISILTYNSDIFDFVEGEKYLVFAEFTSSNSMLKVKKVSNTCKLENAGVILEFVKERKQESKPLLDFKNVEDTIKE
jgi:hypothetical protein